MVKAIPTTLKMITLRQYGCLKKVCIESVAGIGKVIGCRLREQDINTAESLYLMTKSMSQCEFVQWFVVHTRGNRRLAGMAYKTLYGKLSKHPSPRCTRKQHKSKRLNNKHHQSHYHHKSIEQYEPEYVDEYEYQPKPSDVSRVTDKIACFQSRCSQRNVDIGAVAGLGAILACRLREQGIFTASQLRNKTKCFTVCKFKKWLKCRTGANAFQASLAYTCIHELAPIEIVNDKLCTMKTRCK